MSHYERSYPLVLILVLMLILLATMSMSAAAGSRSVPYEGPPAEPAGPSAKLLDPTGCTAGNYGLASFIIMDWTNLGHRYRYYFTGNDGCDTCPIGFQPESLGFTAQLLFPGTYTFELSFAVALPPSDTECAVVGASVCSSGEFEVFVNPGGLYEITQAVACPCALGGTEDYYVELRVVAFQPLGPSGFELNLALDDEYVPCTSMQVMGQDIGIDLADVLGETPPGSLLFWATSSCCQLPVSSGGQSWGSLKSRF